LSSAFSQLRGGKEGYRHKTKEKPWLFAYAINKTMNTKVPHDNTSRLLSV